MELKGKKSLAEIICPISCLRQVQTLPDRCLSNWFLRTFHGRDCTIPIGILVQCFTALMLGKSFLMSKSIVGLADFFLSLS